MLAKTELQPRVTLITEPSEMEPILYNYFRRDDLRKFTSQHSIPRGRDKSDTALNIAMDYRTRIRATARVKG